MENLEEYLETYFDVVAFITERQLWYYEHGEESEEVIYKHYENWGSGGMYDLAKEWTDIFMRDYKDVEWGNELEYYDTIEAFLKNKNQEK